MNRREMLKRSGATAIGLGLAPFGLGWTPSKGPRTRKILMFTRSQGFEHSAIKRKDGNLGFAEQVLTDLGVKHGFEVTCTKDGGVFTAENLAKYDAYFFYTTGDLTKPGGDNNPPMSSEGKAALLDAIHSGKGFIGTHSASDTFHTEPDPAERYKSHGDHVDPYIKMIGGEFIKHGPQQSATMRVMDAGFPGFHEAGQAFAKQLDSQPASLAHFKLDHFAVNEEWYSLKDFQPNLHVLLVQETEGMRGNEYKRAPYPATWARMHGRGRVFFTSMGHREDVWTNPIFQAILLGGISWAVGIVKADVTPNLQSAAPGHAEIPPQ